LNRCPKKQTVKSYLFHQKSPQKSDVKRSTKNSEERMMSTIEDLTEQIVDNFNLLHSKERKGQKYNATHKEEIMTNGVVLKMS
jgi:hypothetical protein